MVNNQNESTSYVHVVETPVTKRMSEIHRGFIGEEFGSCRIFFKYKDSTGLYFYGITIDDAEKHKDEFLSACIEEGINPFTQEYTKEKQERSKTSIRRLLEEVKSLLTRIEKSDHPCFYKPPELKVEFVVEPDIHINQKRTVLSGDYFKVIGQCSNCGGNLDAGHKCPPWYNDNKGIGRKNV